MVNDCNIRDDIMMYDGDDDRGIQYSRCYDGGDDDYDIRNCDKDYYHNNWNDDIYYDKDDHYYDDRRRRYSWCYLNGDEIQNDDSDCDSYGYNDDPYWTWLQIMIMMTMMIAMLMLLIMLTVNTILSVTIPMIKIDDRYNMNRLQWIR